MFSEAHSLLGDLLAFADKGERELLEQDTADQLRLMLASARSAGLNFAFSGSSPDAPMTAELAVGRARLKRRRTLDSKPRDHFLALEDEFVLATTLESPLQPYDGLLAHTSGTQEVPGDARTTLFLKDVIGELEHGRTAPRELTNELREGAVIQGVIKNITEYGAFVDLGGIDGLLHVSDLSWSRVRHPGELLQVGEEVHARILKLDFARNRVALGLKQLSADPWMHASSRYQERTRAVGKVTNITEYGAFVELEPGIEGLVHVSEMNWANGKIDPSSLVSLGDKVEVMVLEVDEVRRRLSLGMKQCVPNPWVEFEKHNKFGDRVKGLVKAIYDHGVLVALVGDVEGFVYQPDLSFTQPAEVALSAFQLGQEVEVLVLDIDVDSQRISLGIKQLNNDPFIDFTSTYRRGSVVTGIVKAVSSEGAEIDLGDNVLGYLRAAEIRSDRGTDARNLLKEGDKVTVVVSDVNPKTRSIRLSIRGDGASDRQSPAAAA